MFVTLSLPVISTEVEKSHYFHRKNTKFGSIFKKILSLQKIYQ